MIKFRDVLKERNFFFLWLGQVISNFGDRLNQMALVALVYQRTPGSAMALAKLISFTVIPVFIIGPVAGVLIDRLNRRHLMIIADILRGLLVLAIPLFIMANQILLIYLAVFLMALIPELVSKEKLLVANTLSDTTHMIGNVAGLVVAGIIVNIPAIGAIGGFYMDAASFFISAALIAMIIQKEFVKDVRRDLEVTREVFESSLRRSVFGEIREGITYLVRYSTMRFVIFALFLLMAAIGTISCVIIIFIQEAFGNATRDLGLLGMFLVGGLFCGALLYGRFGQRLEKRKVILLSFFASGLLIMLFSASVRFHPNLLTSGLMAALLGAAVSPIAASTNTLTHEVIPEEARGRIFSSLEVVIHLAFLLFMFVAAYAANYTDRFWILVSAGAILSVCGLAGSVSGRRKKVI
jgi:DHA3 family macrolide efflux protein-like MFS transporter